MVYVFDSPTGRVSKLQSYLPLSNLEREITFVLNHRFISPVRYLYQSEFAIEIIIILYYLYGICRYNIGNCLLIWQKTTLCYWKGFDIALAVLLHAM